MAKNFKIADLKMSSIYSVSLIDNWDGSTEQKTMTGEELKSFTNAAAHLYDIHATEIETVPEEKKEVKAVKVFDLPCFDSRKSFYGKAKVIEEDNGEKVLQSYNTRVCRITSGGKFVRMWGGSSSTTIRHINSFLQLYDIPGGGKAWWTAQAVEEAPKKPGPDI